ncbi:hypothetical protein L596_016663 [Steinernema carpocapsae]|uniref:Fibrinogen C-terminal domain-containing protein n=1 Tax=Steinernema carpocapsae TaxID=34508 RepID=A0A4V6A3F8_STECR|nr:hypothetical protein L596_016663 [Steinernema carpocapsae]
MPVRIARFSKVFDEDIDYDPSFAPDEDFFEDEEESRWATTMREYNNRDKKVNDTELDPCMAAEVRLKKKRIGTKNRKILLILLAALLLLCLTAVLVILLLNKGDSKAESDSFDTTKSPEELKPASGVLNEPRTFRRPNDNIKATTLLPETSSPEPESATTESDEVEPEDEDEDPTDLSKEGSAPSTLVPKTSKPTKASKAKGDDWESKLAQLDDDTEVNLANANETKKELPFVESEVVRSNCFEYFKDDYLESGVYKLESQSGDEFYAACDMDTDQKGWTIMQRRTDATSFWNRTFDDYANGFGNLGSSHWLRPRFRHYLRFSRRKSASKNRTP